MHLMYPRVTNFTALQANNITNVTLQDILNSPNHFPFQEMAPKNPSWFASLLDKIPGYTWLRMKVGRFIFGPTYEMTAEQRIEYLKNLADEEQLEAERREREAEIKVQTFMAVRHPDWYWKKYIYSQKSGSEERKMAVFKFALANRREYGVYWTRAKDYGRLKVEFDEMGVKIDAKKNIVTVFTEGLERANGKERRDVQGELKWELVVPEEDLGLYLRAREIVGKTSISGLREPRSMRGATERLVAWEDAPMATAKYS